MVEQSQSKLGENYFLLMRNVHWGLENARIEGKDKFIVKARILIVILTHIVHNNCLQLYFGPGVPAAFSCPGVLK